MRFDALSQVAVATALILTACSSGSDHAVGGRGALPGGPADDCAFGYSVAKLQSWTAFAFDGTVTTIGKATPGVFGVRVEFSVHEWFRGGAGRVMTVRMREPQDGSYSVGSRLLVAGDIERKLSPPPHLVAPGCGFLRYFDQSTATSWRAALS